MATSYRFILALAFIAGPAGAGIAFEVPWLPTSPLPTNKDRLLGEADSYSNISWYCSPENMITDPGDWPETVCPYTEPGWQDGVAYQASGYSTLDRFLDGIAAGMGAGDKKTPSYDPRCVGLSCSGFGSVATESGPQLTTTWGTVSTIMAPNRLREGDLVVWYNHHTRIFVRWLTPGDMVVYECTTSVTPARVVERSRSFPNDGTFTPMRLDAMQVDPEPIIQFLREYPDIPLKAYMPFDGEAEVGYRIQHSTNGTSWSTVLNENSVNGYKYSVEGYLQANVNNFLRVVAVNASGAATAPSDVAALRLTTNGRKKVLLVDGIDSWRHRDGGDHPGHTFLIPIAQSLGRLGYPYETAANEMVATHQVDLSDFFAVIWLVGEDSVVDESVNRAEQMIMQQYLEGGGNILLSGSNIGWDLSHQISQAAASGEGGYSRSGRVLDETASDEARLWDRTDGPFMRNYLHFDFLKKAASNEFSALGADGTPLQGLTVSLDDGTHGTYNARFLDCLTPVASGESWLQYSASNASEELSAAVAYEGQFGASDKVGSAVTLAFPLETVYTNSERDALLANVLVGFEAVTAMNASP